MSNTSKILKEVIEVGSIAQLEAEQWFSHNGLHLNLYKTQTHKTDNPDIVFISGCNYWPHSKLEVSRWLISKQIRQENLPIKNTRWLF